MEQMGKETTKVLATPFIPSSYQRLNSETRARMHFERQ